MSSPLFEACVKAAVEKYDSSLALKPKQLESLYPIYNDSDVIVNLPTGYGKSVIYHLLPSILKNKLSADIVTVIVISPLNIIQEDQVQRLHERNVSACRLDFAGQVWGPNGVQGTASEVEKGFYEIVCCHPEALFCSDVGQHLLESRDFQGVVKALVVDECHKIEEWSKEFRQAFQQLHTLRAYFPRVPLAGLSATLTVSQIAKLPDVLGLTNPAIVQETPDRPNIFFSKELKPSSSAFDAYEAIFQPVCEDLFNNFEDFPVTLMYIPLQWMSEAVNFCVQRCPGATIEDSRFACYFSKQDQKVKDFIMSQLATANPHLKLVFCSSSVGMGFDSPSISRVIHTNPPRNVSDYFQQVGRCGRQGQQSVARLHYNARDIASNVPGITEDIVKYCHATECLRDIILKTFGFYKDSNSPAGCKCCSTCKLICVCEDCKVK